MRTVTRSSTTICLMVAVAAATTLGAQDRPAGAASRAVVSPFTVLEADGGVHVTVRAGATYRATLVEGSQAYTRLVVDQSGAMTIEKCVVKCPRGYRAEVDVVVPYLTGISVRNGGRVSLVDPFPRRPHLAISVRHGGLIDVRSLVADRVDASVEQGGFILTAVDLSLTARVSNGGIISYVGNPRVQSSVGHGGAVRRALPTDGAGPGAETGSHGTSRR